MPHLIRWLRSLAIITRSGISSISLAPNRAGVFRCENWTLRGTGVLQPLLRWLRIDSSCCSEGCEVLGSVESRSFSVSGKRTALACTTPSRGLPASVLAARCTVKSVTLCLSAPEPPTPPCWWHSAHDAALKTGPSPSPPLDNGSFCVH